MFSVGYYQQSLVISAIKTTRIDGKNIERLRRLIIQLLHNPCHKLILDLQGITFIDITAFHVLSNLNQIANRYSIELVFENIEKSVIAQFALFSTNENVFV